MKIHRFITPFERNGTTITLDNEAIVHQIHRVLKLRTGEHISVSDTKHVITLVLTDLNKKTIAGTLISEQPATRHAKRSVTLAVAIPKKDDLLELIVQKSVELGVTAIVPITTARTIKNTIREERLTKIIAEAVEQSGQDIPPVLYPVTPIDQIVQTVPHPIICDPRASTPLVAQLQDEITLIIGPEGGLTEEEIATLPTATLGTTTLRIETAAIVASYIGTQL